MPGPITDVDEFSFPITAPEDGDDLTAASLTATATSPEGIGLQGLSNRTRNLFNLRADDLAATALIEGRVDVLEAANTAMDVRADALEARIVNGVMIGPLYAYSSNGVNIIVGSVLSLDIAGTHLGEQAEISVSTLSPAPSANTWYALYAFNNSGVIGYEYSTTMPENNLAFKPTDHTRRFVCTFYSNSIGGVRPFRKSGSKYVYRRSATSETIGIPSFTDAGPTLRSLAVFMPTTSRLACLRLDVVNGTASEIAILRVYSGADTTANSAQVEMLRPPAGAGTYARLYHEIETNSSREISTEVAGAGTPSAVIYVNGYIEGGGP